MKATSVPIAGVSEPQLQMQSGAHLTRPAMLIHMDLAATEPLRSGKLMGFTRLSPTGLLAPCRLA